MIGSRSWTSSMVICGVLWGLVTCGMAQVVPQVEPYVVEPGLANVANLETFMDAVLYDTRKELSFSDAQIDKLVQNGFVVAPGNYEQFFHIYPGTHFYKAPRVPNFVTTDCLLQIYHLLYDFTLRAVEAQHLLPAVYQLTDEMLDRSVEQLDGIADQELRKACLKNISFFGVAAELLGMDTPVLPDDCRQEIAQELEKIRNHQGRSNSSIFSFGHDYTQYQPRGHYAGNQDLERFFLAMMWYGQNSFPFYIEERKTEQQILQAVLITDLLFEDKGMLMKMWDAVYDITSMYVGDSDDLTPHDFRKLMGEVYGEAPSISTLADGARLNLLYQKARDLRKPRIVVQAVGIPPGLQFRFMGQRFIPDSYMMQNLVHWPERPWPKGLDVMAVLGSEQAAEYLDNLYREPEKWGAYLGRRADLIEEFGELSEEQWYRNLYFGWIYVLQALLEDWGDGYPSFMRNDAWVDKELNTGLASWAELRHDVILYGKPSMAEGGDGEHKEEMPKGYVEPVPEFFRRLWKLTNMNKEVLIKHEYKFRNVVEVFDRYLELLDFLKGIAEKELMNVPRTEDEYKRIRFFGATIELLSLRIVELDRNLPTFDWITGEQVESDYVHLRGWFEVIGPDRDLACIADVHTVEDNCLEEAVGHLNTIYVIIPVDGELRLTRGGVFSYYEFQYQASHRLTDEAWQSMIKRGCAPDPPEWSSSFVVD